MNVMTIAWVYNMFIFCILNTVNTHFIQHMYVSDIIHNTICFISDI